jgi:hypothetical protein
MPDDLIERIASQLPYEATTSHVAIEWAARECGAQPNQYQIRTLFGHLEKSRSHCKAVAQSAHSKQ